jgi:acyl carrier protein
VNAEFETVLRKHLNYLAPDAALDPDADLKDLGLDSMKAVDLVFDLEDDLHIALPDQAMTGATFATPRSLWAALTDAHDQAVAR